MDISGKTFLVTGGAQGMGRCFTHELAKLGANVLFCDLNPEKIQEVESECTEYTGSVRGIVLNVAEQDHIEDGNIVRGIDRSTENMNTFINTAIEY